MLKISSLIIILCLIFGSAEVNSLIANAEEAELLEELIRKIEKFDRQGQLDSSFFYYDSAARIAKDNGDKLNLAYLNILKGTDYIILSEPDSALFYLNAARVSAKQLRNDTIYIAATLNAGYALHRMGKSDSAESLYLECLELSTDIGWNNGEARSLNLLNILYKHTGQFAKGLDAAQRSLYLFEKLGDKRNYISGLTSLANIYMKIDKPDSAYRCYKLCYELSVEEKDTRNEFISLFNLAIIDMTRGEKFARAGRRDSADLLFKKAENAFSRLVETSEAKSDRTSMAESYLGLAQVNILRGKYREAIAYANQGLEISTLIKDELLAIEALEFLGLSHFKLGDEQTAERFYLRGYEKANKARNYEAMLHISIALADIYSSRGDDQMANTFLRSHISNKDSIYNTEKEKLIQEYQANFEIQRLKDLREIDNLKKEKLRNSRNNIFAAALFIILLLTGLFLFFWMRARKNRVISLQRIQQLENEKKILAAQSVIVGQEEERKRIARELHDGIGVLLSTARIQFSTLDEDESDPKTVETFRKAEKMLENASREVRRISHDMMPGVLSKFGLREAIEDMFDEVKEATEMDINLVMHCSRDRLPDNLEIMLYRVVQELINNTLKHAEASRISCTINRTPDSITIDYADDGIGFDEKSIPNDKSLGISGIRSRIDFLSGTVTISSQKGKGTQFQIFVPLHVNVRHG